MPTESVGVAYLRDCRALTLDDKTVHLVSRQRQEKTRYALPLLCNVRPTTDQLPRALGAIIAAQTPLERRPSVEGANCGRLLAGSSRAVAVAIEGSVARPIRTAGLGRGTAGPACVGRSEAAATGGLTDQIRGGTSAGCVSTAATSLVLATAGHTGKGTGGVGLTKQVGSGTGSVCGIRPETAADGIRSTARLAGVAGGTRAAREATRRANPLTGSSAATGIAERTAGPACVVGAGATANAGRTIGVCGNTLSAPGVAAATARAGAVGTAGCGATAGTAHLSWARPRASGEGLVADIACATGLVELPAGCSRGSAGRSGGSTGCGGGSA